VTEPAGGQVLRRVDVAVRGLAWSGAAPVGGVDVDMGAGWRPARLVGERHGHGWQRWELLTHMGATGPVTIRARATDLAGRTQPDGPDWNRLGYGNNAVHAITLSVE
jgi:Mo-co oxidoreductase dimerisation domain